MGYSREDLHAHPEEEIALRTATLPSNHSPLFAPVIDPTLTIGVNAPVAAAHTWLPSTGNQ